MDIKIALAANCGYTYWFQKTTGERLYSEADVQELLQELSRPTRRPADGAVRSIKCIHGRLGECHLCEAASQPRR
jgi:hypothetical protein